MRGVDILKALFAAELRTFIIFDPLVSTLSGGYVMLEALIGLVPSIIVFMVLTGFWGIYIRYRRFL